MDENIETRKLSQDIIDPLGEMLKSAPIVPISNKN